MADTGLYEAWFDTEENKALLAICARHLIRNVGIGGIVWGSINLLIGLPAVFADLIYLGVPVLGLTMLIAGIAALNRPTVKALLVETIVCLMLFGWNVFINYWDFRHGGELDGQGLVVPLVIAFAFGRYYIMLAPKAGLIASVPADRVKATKDICKAIRKKKLKNEPGLVQSTDGKWRVQLLPGRAFFVQRKLEKAFIVTPEQFVQVTGEESVEAFEASDVKRIKMEIRHPVEKTKLAFDAGNTAKIRTWLTGGNAPPPLPG